MSRAIEMQVEREINELVVSYNREDPSHYELVCAIAKHLDACSDRFVLDHATVILKLCSVSKKHGYVPPLGLVGMGYTEHSLPIRLGEAEDHTKGKNSWHGYKFQLLGSRVLERSHIDRRETHARLIYESQAVRRHIINGFFLNWIGGKFNKAEQACFSRLINETRPVFRSFLVEELLSEFSERRDETAEIMLNEPIIMLLSLAHFYASEDRSILGQLKYMAKEESRLSELTSGRLQKAIDDLTKQNAALQGIIDRTPKSMFEEPTPASLRRPRRKPCRLVQRTVSIIPSDPPAQKKEIARLEKTRDNKKSEFSILKSKLKRFQNSEETIEKLNQYIESDKEGFATRLAELETEVNARREEFARFSGIEANKTESVIDQWKLWYQKVTDSKKLIGVERARLGTIIQQIEEEYNELVTMVGEASIGPAYIYTEIRSDGSNRILESFAELQKTIWPAKSENERLKKNLMNVKSSMREDIPHTEDPLRLPAGNLFEEYQARFVRPFDAWNEKLARRRKRKEDAEEIMRRLEEHPNSSDDESVSAIYTIFRK